MKALQLLKKYEHNKWVYIDNKDIKEAIKELEDIQKDMQAITDDKRDKTIKSFHKDWIELTNEMTIRMGYKTIDMSFLTKFYSYIEDGYPVWEHEEKREISLKYQEKIKALENYCSRLEKEIRLLKETK
jgi:ABC-type Zn uptake system ZnuABC Zn-binding protein ZnuA